jgi:hypothetical protein
MFPGRTYPLAMALSRRIAARDGQVVETGISLLTVLERTVGFQT